MMSSGTCIKQAKSFLLSHEIRGEVILAGNGSTDRSVETAKSKGAVIVHMKQNGYGNALRGGLEVARGKFIIMADADESYDLENLMPFVEKLREGYDFVMSYCFKSGF